MFRNIAFAALLVVGLAACAATSPQTTKLSAPATTVECEITTVENFMNTRLQQFPNIATIVEIDSPQNINAAKKALREEAGPDSQLRDFDTIYVLGIPGQPVLGLVFTLNECFQGEHVAPAESIVDWLVRSGAMPATQGS